MWNIGEGLAEAFIFLFVVAAVCMPLAVWKVIEIAIWLYQHVSISWV